MKTKITFCKNPQMFSSLITLTPSPTFQTQLMRTILNFITRGVQRADGPFSALIRPVRRRALEGRAQKGAGKKRVV